MTCERVPMEDELGDVLEKALALTGQTAAEAAARARLPESRLRDAIDYRYEFEGDELDRLAGVLDLRVGGLRALLAGQYPLPCIDGLPFCVRALRCEHGIGVANAYLVGGCSSDSAVLFDAGCGFEKLEPLWPKNVRRLDGICITHEEREHCGGVAESLRRFGPAPVFAPAALRGTCAATLGEGAKVTLGALSIEVLATPGHAAAHNCYLVTSPRAPASSPLLIAGDLIFAGSVGGGYADGELLQRHVRRLVERLPAGTVIAPGHGPMTTLANELANNPFLHPEDFR